ncbi:MAG: hypothetical protein EBR86_15035, partial [Planctomycetia bacterium]|nr:hypothetical protein [Planctomycetia bacterium]
MLQAPLVMAALVVAALGVGSGGIGSVWLGLPAASARAQEPRQRDVVAMVVLDSYADMKKQLAWLGPQIDNPNLAPMLESLIMLGTQ